MSLDPGSPNFDHDLWYNAKMDREERAARAKHQPDVDCVGAVAQAVLLGGVAPRRSAGDARRERGGDALPQGLSVMPIGRQLHVQQLLRVVLCDSAMTN